MQKKKNSTQSYTNSEGHITANECNEKKKLSLLQALEVI
jgi:hypothetical protein